MRRPPTRQGTRPSLEVLEDRVVPATIAWMNRGGADNFAAVFGGNANLARSVVDTAISEWQTTISYFNYLDGSNTLKLNIFMDPGASSAGGSTSVTSIDGSGKPEAANITLGRWGARDSAGGLHGWYLDPQLFSSAFMGTPSNAFAAYAQDGSPAQGLVDLMTIAARQIGVAAGLYAGAQVNAHVVDTGVPDTVSGGGHLYAFTKGSDAFLMSSLDGLAGDTHGGAHTAPLGTQVNWGSGTLSGSDDLMNANYQLGQRKIISSVDARILGDSYGYAVGNPSGNFYMIVDPTDHELLIRGRQDGAGYSSDTVSFGTGLVNGKVWTYAYLSMSNPVPGTGYDYTFGYSKAFDPSTFSSIRVLTGQGGGTVKLNSFTYAPNVPVTIGNVGGIFGTKLDIDYSTDGSNHTVNVGQDYFMGIGTGIGYIDGLLATNTSITYTTNLIDSITLRTGTGTNVINVLDVTNPLTLEPHSSNTTVNVGNAGSLGTLQYGLDVYPAVGAQVSLNIDDSADTATRSYTVRANQVTSDKFPVAVNYDSTRLQSLVLKGGSGDGTTYTVEDTPAGSTTVMTASPTATVNVLGTTGSLFVASGGANTVNVGNQGLLQAIQGTVGIGTATVGARNTIVVDDSADNQQQQHDVVITKLAITGLAPATIGYGGINATTQLSILGGNNGGTIFSVPALGAMAPLSITGGGLDELVGPNEDTTWTISGSYSGQMAPALWVNPVSFSNIWVLQGGTGSDSFAFTSADSRMGVIYGGAGNNTLDYSAYPGDVEVALARNYATGTVVGVSSIQNVIGTQGAYNDVLAGSSDTNSLIGGGGRNILIAGTHGATLIGGGNDDILIGGYTKYDADVVALRALMAEWSRTDLGYDARVSDIMNGGLSTLNGDYVLNASTVTSNGQTNTLTGNGGSDLYFGSLTRDSYDWTPASGLTFIDLG
jgi:hypothetical protein